MVGASIILNRQICRDDATVERWGLGRCSHTHGIVHMVIFWRFAFLSFVSFFFQWWFFRFFFEFISRHVVWSVFWTVKSDDGFFFQFYDSTTWGEKLLMFTWSWNNRRIDACSWGRGTIVDIIVAYEERDLIWWNTSVFGLTFPFIWTPRLAISCLDENGKGSKCMHTRTDLFLPSWVRKRRRSTSGDPGRCPPQWRDIFVHSVVVVVAAAARNVCWMGPLWPYYCHHRKMSIEVAFSEV